MTSAYVLIAAILVLGGLLATLGDRLGSKIGKARLRLFKLRPRQTAVVVTVGTGILISASTLGILFALSESLRQGVFELDEIKKQRRQVESELNSVTAQKKQVEDELVKATNRQQEVNLLLTEINGKFQAAQQQLSQVSTKAKKLDIEVKKLVTEREQLQQLRNQLKTQIGQLETQSAQLKTRISELQNQVATQNKDLLAKEQTIINKDQLIAQREQNLLDKEQTILEKQKTIINQEQTISQKEKNIKQKEKLLVQKQREINEKQRLINEKQDEINLKTNILASKEIELAKLEKKANELELDIENRDKLINELDQKITLKDDELQAKETQLKVKEEELQAKEASLQELQTQMEFLKREVAILEQYYQNYQVLRQGNVALLRGQVLAFAAVRIVKPEIANQAIDQLLSQANRTALKVTQPLNPENSEQRIVQITNSQVTQLSDQIKDGQDYVVRILSAGNYVQGENQIRVFADVAPNKLVYQNNENIATISLDSITLTDEELDQKMDLLLATTRFRARRSGILGEIQIEDGSLILLINFLETLKKSVQPLDEIRAVASETTYSAGPLKVRLLALQNGKVIYSTSSPLTINN